MSEPSARCQCLKNVIQAISLFLQPLSESILERISALERARESLDTLYVHEDNKTKKELLGNTLGSGRR